HEQRWACYLGEPGCCGFSAATGHRVCSCRPADPASLQIHVTPELMSSTRTAKPSPGWERASTATASFCCAIGKDKTAFSSFSTMRETPRSGSRTQVERSSGALPDLAQRCRSAKGQVLGELGVEFDVVVEPLDHLLGVS